MKSFLTSLVLSLFIFQTLFFLAATPAAANSHCYVEVKASDGTLIGAGNTSGGSSTTIYFNVIPWWDSYFTITYFVDPSLNPQYVSDSFVFKLREDVAHSGDRDESVNRSSSNNLIRLTSVNLNVKAGSDLTSTRILPWRRTGYKSPTGSQITADSFTRGFHLQGRLGSNNYEDVCGKVLFNWYSPSAVCNVSNLYSERAEHGGGYVRFNLNTLNVNPNDILQIESPQLGWSYTVPKIGSTGTTNWTTNWTTNSSETSGSIRFNNLNIPNSVNGGIYGFTLKKGSKMLCSGSVLIPDAGEEVTAENIEGLDGRMRTGEKFPLCQQLSGDAQRECQTCFDQGQKMWTGLGCISTDSTGLFKDLITIAIGMAGGVGLLTFAAAAFKLTLAGGNDPKSVTDAKESLGAVGAGLLLIIFSVTLLQFIGVTILRIPGFGT